MHRSMRHGGAAGIVAAGLLLAAAGCTTPGGNFSLLGYTTVPNYDPCIRTVYVPIAQNISYRKGLEFDVTRLVVREIETRTPFKVVSCREQADTELLLKVINWRKNLIIATQLNLVRESEINVGVEVLWRDLRPGRVGDLLSSAKPTIPEEQPLPGEKLPAPTKDVPVLLLPVATYQPELGGTTASADWQACERVAKQICNMMEKGW